MLPEIFIRLDRFRDYFEKKTKRISRVEICKFIDQIQQSFMNELFVSIPESLFTWM